MPATVWMISYKLKEGADVEDFLRASEACNREVLSRQKGYISWEVLRCGGTWVDLCKWETPEDAKNAETAGADNPAALEFYSFINMESLEQQLCSLEKSY